MPIQSSNPPELITIEQWAGLNQMARRASIEDQEMWWSLNMFPLGPGNLRSLWGHSPPIYTSSTGAAIVRIFGFDLNCTAYCACLLADGNVDMVELDTGVVHPLGVIWASGAPPPAYHAAVKVWIPIGPKGAQPGPGGSGVGDPTLGIVMIGSSMGLYAWDGVTLYSPGDPAPDNLTNLAQETNPNPGGGSAGDTQTVMPDLANLDILGMEVFMGSLWLLSPDVITFSAPGNGADFATADGGGAFPYQGDLLVCEYNAIRATGGFMYLFGDSSTDVISNVQTSTQQATQTTAAQTTTTFTRVNVDPQVGQAWPREVGVWGRAFTLGNESSRKEDAPEVRHGGAMWVLYGGATQLVSKNVTDFISSLNSNDFLPTMAPADIFGRRVMLYNARLTDPWHVTKNYILIWLGDLWTVAYQGLDLTHITSHERNSLITPYGTDSQHLFRLFSEADPTLEKRLSTKSMRGQSPLGIKNWKRVYLEFADNTRFGVSITGSMITEAGGIPNGTQELSFDLPPGRFDIIPFPLQGAGILGSIDLTSLSPDFTIERIHVAYEDRALFGA